MIDFENKSLFKLKQDRNCPHNLEPLLLSGEQVISSYSSIGKLVFEFTGGSDIVAIGKIIAEYVC